MTAKRLIALIIILLAIASVNAEITSWNNSYTNDSATNLTAEINTTITFYVALNQTSNVTWQIDNTSVISEENITSSNFTYNFTVEGKRVVRASNGPDNITWTVQVYKPLEITDFSNNITNSNTTDLEMGLGSTAFFWINRTGTIESESWSINDVPIINGQNFTFHPEKYGPYNISYRLGGTARSMTLNWTVKVYLNVTDALNSSIKFYSAPNRIISLAPSTTEILFAVNLSHGLVGVDDYSDYPPEIANMTVVRVGGPYTGISLEAIVNLTPDLVVATGINPLETIDLLQGLNITVLTVDSKTVQEILDNIWLLGMVGGNNNIAGAIVQNLTSRIEDVEDFSKTLAKQRKPSLFYVVWYPELWTAGKDTYAHDLIEMAGGVNTAEDGDGWFMMNKEVLISEDPDVIVCSGMGGYGATVCNQIRNDTALSGLSAVKNNRMYVFPDSNIVERPGPRIVDGLESFYEIVKDNLKQIVQPQTSGGGGATPTEKTVEKTIFKGDFQDYTDVKADLFEELKGKIQYTIDNNLAALPLLLLNRVPTLDGMEGVHQSFSEDLIEYSADVAVFKYFFAREVIVARSDLEVDAFAALSLAKYKNIPIILTKRAEVSLAALEALDKISPRKIIIVGGPEAVDEDVEDRLKRYGDVERVWGETRVETSIEIARLTGSDKVIITNPDSNVEAAVTSQTYGAPIIYVSPEKQDMVIEYLRAHRPKILFIDVDEEIKNRIKEEV